LKRWHWRWSRPRKHPSAVWLTDSSSQPAPAVEFHVPNGLELATSTAAASWLEQRIWQWDRDYIRVGSVIPEGFAGYARIVHPAESNSETVSGSLPREMVGPLRETLRGLTTTPERCWFAVWEGFGFLDRGRYEHVRKVTIPNRAYLLFRGSIDAMQSMDWGPWRLSWQTPNLWWPDDRAWCVATEIDLAETYVGGSDGCIQQILGNAELDATPLQLDARIIDGQAVDPEESPMS